MFFFSSSLDRWDEERAAMDDAAKSVEKVELGASLAFEEAPPDAGLGVLQQLVLKHCSQATEFYSSPGPSREDFAFDGELLTFSSAISTETPESDLVRARVIESKRRRAAVVVLPHWSAPTWAYYGFVRHFARLGLTAVEVALPYHGERTREGSLIADHFLSANLGRTIRSVRQAVVDTKDIVTWLRQRGHDSCCGDRPQPRVVHRGTGRRSRPARPLRGFAADRRRLRGGDVDGPRHPPHSARGRDENDARSTQIGVVDHQHRDVCPGAGATQLQHFDHFGDQRYRGQAIFDPEIRRAAKELRR